jgi:PASTA domain
MRIVKFVLPFACALAIPTSAGATTFCVGQPAGCSGVALTASQLETEALHSSQLNNGQPDLIVLGPGVYVDSDSFTLGAGTDALEIRGSGEDATVLTSTGVAAGTLLDLDTLMRPVALRKLSVEVPSTWLDGPVTYGVKIRGLVEDVRVTSQNPKTAAIQAGGSTTLRRVDVTANQAAAVVGADGGPDITVEDSRLSGLDAIYSGNYATPVTMHVSRSILTTTSGASNSAALHAGKGLSEIHDSLLRVRSNGVSMAVGIWATYGSVIADHVTIVRDAGPLATTIGIWAYAPGDTNAQINLANSVISRVSETGRRTGSPDGSTGVAKLLLDYDLMPTAFPVGTGKGFVLSGAGNLINPDPGFVDVAAGDFHVLAGSPAIDSGDPEFAGATTGLDGLARLVDGNGDGTTVTDRGAYELPAPLGPPASDPAPIADPVGGTADPVAPPAAPAVETAAAPKARTCRVPKLRGRTLAAAKRALRRAGCRVGKLSGTKVRGKRVRVRSQRVRAGRTVPLGTKVRLVLAVRR